MGLFRKKVVDDLLDNESSNESGQKSLTFLKSKKVLIPLGVVLVIGGMIVVKSILGGSSDSSNYFDDLNAVFTNELGHFKYQVAIQTGARGSLISESGENLSADELNNLSSAEETASGSAVSDDNTDEVVNEVVDQKHKFTEWIDYSRVKVDNWQYPNYTITIEGTTNSLEPLETDFTIDITTPYLDGETKFTEVVVKDGIYHLDILAARDWLLNSGDAYLMEVGYELPDGAKWLDINEEDFLVVSRFAEADELQYASSKGIVTPYRRFLVYFTTLTNTIKNALGKRGQTYNTGVTTLNLTGDDANTLVSGIRSLTCQAGSYYENVAMSGVDKGLYTEDEYYQFCAEKDNFLDAVSDLSTDIQTCSGLDLNVTGNTRVYQNNNGNTAIDATLGVQYHTDTTDYIVQFTGYRLGEPSDQKPVSGSSTKYTVELGDLFRDSFNKIADYFNPTSIKLGNRLDYDSQNGYNLLMQAVADTVNKAGTYDTYLTVDNVSDFLSVYANYEVADDSSEAEIKNSEIASEFFDTMTMLQSNIKQRKKVKELVIEQYPVAAKTIDKVKFDASYNAKLSNKELIVVDVTITNKSSKKVKVDLKKFSLHNPSNSIYPANNETLVRGHDSSFDMKKLKKSATLNAKSNNTYRLYFVVSNSNEKLDCFYNSNVIGTVIAY